MDRTERSRPAGTARGRWCAPVLSVALLLSALACSHDWSLAGADATLDDASTAEGDAPADDAADRADRVDAPADVGVDADATDDGVAPRCGDGVVDHGEDCDPPFSTETCTVGTCTGSRLCDAACLWKPCDLGAPPADDACDTVTDAAALTDTVGAQTLHGSTCGATDDGMATACGPAAGPDVLVRLDLTHNRLVTFDTVGSEFDAVLRLLDGPTCPGTELACDDDSSDVAPGQAQLVALLTPGTYWLAIDGKDAAAFGAYVLNADIQDLGMAPANDTCASAVRLTLIATPRTRTGSTAGAGSERSSCAIAPGPDVWYTFTLAARTLVYFDVLDGESWNSVLEVRRAGTVACGDMTSLACVDDACGTARSHYVGVLDAGDYYLLVDGRTISDSGSFRLTYQGITTACAVAAAGLLADGAVTGTTRGLSDVVRPSCIMNIGVPDAFYFMALCPGVPFSATTCDVATEFDTLLALYAGGCADANEVACNNDQRPACPASLVAGVSTLTYTASAAGLYLLAVTGPGFGTTAAGAFGLSVSGL